MVIKMKAEKFPFAYECILDDHIVEGKLVIGKIATGQVMASKESSAIKIVEFKLKKRFTELKITALRRTYRLSGFM